MRPLATLGGVLEPLLQQQPVRQPGQRIVQRAVVEAFGGGAGLFAGLGVEQVGGRDVRQRLGRAHVVRVELAGGVAVQVERAEPALAVAQREREHRGQPGRPGRRGEHREPIVGVQVGDRHGLPGFVRHQARALADLGLQLLEAQRGLVRSGDVARRHPGRDQRDPRRRDRQDLDDPFDEVVEDALDREVGDQRARELAEHRRQLVLIDHDHHPGTGKQARAWSGRDDVDYVRDAA